MTTPVLSTNHIRSLDTLRFVCALWVVMGHFGPPPITIGIDKTSTAGWVVNSVFNNSFSGPCAVMVFFVISGFCINYPHTSSNTITSLPAYFSRRYVRIVGPMTVAILIARYGLLFPLDLFDKTILWSLFAELVYYTIYPAFLALRRARVPWAAMIGASFLASLALALTNPLAGDFPSFGWQANWLLGLPSWLIGCRLAESVAAGNTPRSGANIWLWRGGILALSILCSAARFHSPIGYPWSLNFFSIAVAAWLAQEISYAEKNPPLQFTEWARSWSYSLYLTHGLAMAVFAMFSLPNLGFFINWSIQMTFMLTAAYLFFIAIESPFHHLARRASRLFSAVKPEARTSTRVALVVDRDSAA